MLSIKSDVTHEYHKFKERAEAFPQAIDVAVGNNAKLVLGESIVQIDAILYSTPETPGYRRTKNLRRSNKIEKIADMAWLVYNDAEYAGFVHDGTSVMPARPWMQNAIDAKLDEMAKNLQDAGVEVLTGGEVRVDETLNDSGEEQQPSGGGSSG